MNLLTQSETIIDAADVSVCCIDGLKETDIIEFLHLEKKPPQPSQIRAKIINIFVETNW